MHAPVPFPLPTDDLPPITPGEWGLLTLMATVAASTLILAHLW